MQDILDPDNFYEVETGLDDDESILEQNGIQIAQIDPVELQNY
jgi:hypothetical protein